jgi:hypothetical protein
MQASVLWQAEMREEAHMAIAECAEEATARGGLGYVNYKLRAYLPEPLWRPLSAAVEEWARFGSDEASSSALVS